KAAHQNLALAQYDFARYHWINEGDDAEYGKWLCLAAEQDLPQALNDMALYLQDKIDDEITKDKIVVLFQRAADQGLAAAQHNLALCALEGYGIDKNIKQAIELFEKAAMQGYAYAQYHLALLYQKEPYKEDALSLYWLKKAADQGLSCAQQDLV